MVDKEILKALECCKKLTHNGWSANQKICEEECPYKANCYDEEKNINMLSDVFDLINRQQAEIERLSNSAKQWEDTAKDLLISKEKQQAEIERLNKENETVKAYIEGNGWGFVSFLEFIKKTKAEAIKEFAERLKEDLGIWNFDFTYYADRAEARGYIDNLVKEMVGEDK